MRRRVTIGLLVVLSAAACHGDADNRSPATGSPQDTPSASTISVNPVVSAGLLIPSDSELMVAPFAGEPALLRAPDSIRWTAPDGNGGVVVELESGSVLHLARGTIQPTQVIQLERSTPPIAVVNGSLLWITRDDGGKLMRQPLEGREGEMLVRGKGINFADINQTASDGFTLAMLRRGEDPYVGDGCVNDPGFTGKVMGFPGARFEIVSIQPGPTEPANPYDEAGAERCQQGPSTGVQVGGGHLFWVEVSPIQAPGILDFDLATGDLRRFAIPDSSWFDVTPDGTVFVWGKWGVTVQSTRGEAVAADLASEVLDRAFADGSRVAGYTSPIDLADDATLTP
jgi:hypothetical protein